MRIAVACILLIAGTAAAQSTIDKTYNVSGKPALQIEVDDASVRARSCGTCRAVSIHVDYKGQNPNDWAITELQGGNGIHFALKHRTQVRMWSGWRGRSPEVTVTTPTETDLSLRSGDGALSIAGVRGVLDAHTGDGAISAEEVAGALRLTTGDGAVSLSRAEGTLFATTGDGSMTLEGRFAQFDAHSGDGTVNLRLLPGSTLGASSTVTTGDGSINLTLPRDLRAEVDASSGDGSINSSLPLMTTTSGGRGHSRLHGTLNGGGQTLRLHTGDGSINLNAN